LEELGRLIKSSLLHEDAHSKRTVLTVRWLRVECWRR